MSFVDELQEVARDLHNIAASHVTAPAPWSETADRLQGAADKLVKLAGGTTLWDQAYNDGYTARVQGVGKEACPFRNAYQRTLKYWWKGGWHDADRAVKSGDAI